MGDPSNVSKKPLLYKSHVDILHGYRLGFSATSTQLKDRITPHVTNFSRFRLGIEKQEGKRKYKSDGAVMVGEFVCVCMFKYSE